MSLLGFYPLSLLLVLLLLTLLIGVKFSLYFIMNFHNKSINPFRLQKLIQPIQPFLLQALLVSSSHIYLTFLSMLTFLFTLATNNSSVKGKQACTVCLPYSSVPGMDFSSRAYTKALATLTKQAHKDHNTISCFTCSKSSNDNSMDIGMSFIFLLFFFSLWLFYLQINLPLLLRRLMLLLRLCLSLSSILFAMLTTLFPTPLLLISSMKMPTLLRLPTGTLFVVRSLMAVQVFEST